MGWGGGAFQLILRHVSVFKLIKMEIYKKKSSVSWLHDVVEPGNNDKSSILPNFFGFIYVTNINFIRIAPNWTLKYYRHRDRYDLYPKISHFLYANEKCIYNVSCLDLHFWLRMAS